MLSKLLTRREQMVLLALAVSLLVGSATLYLFRAPATPETTEALTLARVQASVPAETRPEERRPAEPEAPAANVAPAPPVEATTSVTVSVRGAVALPGVYEFSKGARVQEAVDRAGGALDTADLSDVNLAARLLDGTTLTVPEAPDRAGRATSRPGPANLPEYTVSGWRPSAVAPTEAAATGSSTGAGALDLNAASETELQGLPGIGPKLASEIIKYRSATPFSRVEDLLNVSGIGPKRLDSIRPFVSVR